MRHFISYLSMCILISCGGGVVDNGHEDDKRTKPETGKSAFDVPPQAGSQVDPARTALFNGKYVFDIPKPYDFDSEDASTARFTSEDGYDLVFTRDVNLCAAAKLKDNNHKVEIYECDTETDHYKFEDGKVLELKHQLNAEDLDLIRSSIQVTK